MTRGIGRLSTRIAATLAGVALIGWLIASRGPLAPATVTLAPVAQGPLVAGTFGIGTVEARRSYAIGPTIASRVARVLVDQGDVVKPGQLLAELDPVDLDERIASGALAAERAANAVRAAQALLAETRSREQLALASARRVAELRAKGFVSQEAVDAKGHEANAAKAASDAAQAQLDAARHDRDRALSDAAGVGKLRAQARLLSPAEGVISARLVEPGSTVVAGQAVLQLIEPSSLWIRARIDQGQAGGVRAGQPAEVVLRSDAARVHAGSVQRVDWTSDPVTEERIVHVGFDARAAGASLGELVEVTIRTAEISTALSVPAAAVRRIDRRDGVWQFADGRIRFRPVTVGITTLDGRSQILEGLDPGEQVVVHSEQPLKPDARVRVAPEILRTGS